jgi:hypothetical protein
MQRYNIKDTGLLGCLSALQEATDKISVTLSIEDFDYQSVEDLSILYNKRNSLLDKFNSWRESADGQTYIRKYPDDWAKLIEKLMDRDKKNLENMDIKLEALKKNIRNLEKQKSVLIYRRQII